MTSKIEEDEVKRVASFSRGMPAYKVPEFATQRRERGHGRWKWQSQPFEAWSTPTQTFTLAALPCCLAASAGTPLFFPRTGQCGEQSDAALRGRDLDGQLWLV